MGQNGVESKCCSHGGGVIYVTFLSLKAVTITNFKYCKCYVKILDLHLNADDSLFDMRKHEIK